MNIEEKYKTLTYIASLITASMQNTLTNEKEKELQEWLNSSDDNKELYDHITNQIVIRDKIKLYNSNEAEVAYNRFIIEKTKLQQIRRRPWYIYPAAAVALIAILTALFFVLPTKEKAVQTSSIDNVDTKNMPSITLSDGTNILIDKNGFSLPEKNGINVTIDEGGIYYDIPKSNGNVPIFNTVSTPSSCDYSFILSDGTKIWMNAKSSVKYPIEFKGNIREITVDGEIFLNVAHNPSKPFIVRTENMNVRVLGTEFNIHAYNDDIDKTITLKSGSVEAIIGSDTYKLTPNKQIQFNSLNNEIKINNVNVDDIISWIHGEYIFKGEKLFKMMHTLSRWYDIDVVFQDNRLKDFLYTGVLNKDENIDAFIHRLQETSNIKCKLTNKQLYIFY